MNPSNPTRRRLLSGAAAGVALSTLGAPAVRAQAAAKLRIGFWPVASGLPFFAAVDKGYFKEAGLDVEPMKFASAQQVMEAMLSGRADGSGLGLAIAREIDRRFADPGGGFFATDAGGERLLVRTKPTDDGVLPSANAVAIDVMLRLAILTEDARWRAKATTPARPSCGCRTTM